MRKLRLRDHVYVAPTPSGAHILTLDGPVSLTGPSVARWIEALAPRLDGRFSVEEITSGLPEAHAAMATSLITRLREAGVVREVPDGDARAIADPPSADVAELSYLDAHGVPAEAALARFRRLAVVVVADDDWSTAVADALRRCGAADVRTHPAADPPADDLPVDLLLHVTGAADGESHRRIERLARWRGAAAAYALLDGADVWLTPVLPPGSGGDAAPAPSSLLARLPEAPQTAAPIAEVHRTVAVAQLVRAAFGWATDTGAPRRAGKLTRLGPDLATRRLHCLPHPFCAPVAAPDPDGFLARVAALRGSPAVADRDFSTSAVRAADDTLGPFRYLSDDAVAQSPLTVARAQARDPLARGLGCDAAGAAVRAVAFDYPTARVEAARRALTRYAGLMVDPRRLVDGAGRPLAPGDAEADDLHRLLRAGLPDGHVYGLDLASGTVLPVPVATVFTRLAVAVAAPVGLGEGFGPSWDAAVARGLASHWSYDPALIADAAGRPVRVEATDLDDVGRRCLTLLTEFGEVPQVHDHGGRHGVSVLSFRRDGVTVARTSGAGVDAWRRGLLEVTFVVQRLVHGGGYRPPAAAATRAGTPAPVDAGFDVAAAVAGLAAIGRRAVVVPLDHDPAVAAIAANPLKVVIVNG
ncbi:hypothetical protein OG989_19710 [Micromonospora sp. NBC_01740]|uniref:hypothetical protein n=1 Tax=Micromonospora sp. NBC_01740 TaxID=2975986 RepID=UPI002E0E1DAC|nr:hypothetical protein OG989_19710 [Micromonospora sp. NBC_01740]